MMRKTALIAMTLLFGSVAIAQTTAPAAPPKPTAHPPGVAAQPGQAAAPAPAAKASALGKIDPIKEAAIRHLMDITQSAKLGDNIDTYISNQVQAGVNRAIAPEKVSQFMTTFNQKLAASAPPAAVATAMVPIYDRLLSLEDVQALNQFYESPVGQRTLKALPQIVRETEDLAVQMQQKAALAVLQGMSADYPELKAMLAPQDGPGSPSVTPALPPR